MKKFLIFISLLCSGSFADAKSKIVAAAGPLFDKVPSSQVVGVLPLENTLQDEPEAGKSIAEILVNLGNAKGIKIVERDQLAKVMEEQSLIASGAVSEENAAEIGNLLSAQFLMTGRLSELMGERLVGIKLINTESGEVVGSANVSLGADAFKSMQKELLGEATQTSAVVFRSTIIPGWGQMYAGKSGRGSVWTTLAVAGVGAIFWSLGEKNKADDAFAYYSDASGNESVKLQKEFCESRDCNGETLNITSTAEEVELFSSYRSDWLPEKEKQALDDYNSKVQTQNIIMGVTAAIWLANIVDSYIVGSERKKKMDLYFTAIPSRDPEGELGANVMVGFNF